MLLWHSTATVSLPSCIHLAASSPPAPSTPLQHTKGAAAAVVAADFLLMVAFAHTAHAACTFTDLQKIPQHPVVLFFRQQHTMLHLQVWPLEGDSADVVAHPSLQSLGPLRLRPPCMAPPRLGPAVRGRLLGVCASCHHTVGGCLAGAAAQCCGT